MLMLERLQQTLIWDQPQLSSSNCLEVMGKNINFVLSDNNPPTTQLDRWLESAVLLLMLTHPVHV